MVAEQPPAGAAAAAGHVPPHPPVLVERVEVLGGAIQDLAIAKAAYVKAGELDLPTLGL